jgi:hypothetical protein
MILSLKDQMAKSRSEFRHVIENDSLLGISAVLFCSK